MRRCFDGRHRPTSRTRQRGGFARPSKNLRGTTGQDMSLIEADAVAATEAVAVPGRHPRRGWLEDTASRDAIAAEQEAADHCRKTRRGRRRRRHGNCIEGPCAAMRVRIVLVEGRRIAQQN